MVNHSIVPLSSKKHAKLTYSPLTDYSFTANQTFVPLMNFEVVQAAECFPVIFPDKNLVVPYAMLGLGNKNIFLESNGHWKTSYLPLMIANHPFSLIDAVFQDDPEKKHTFAIGIEEDAPEFAQKDGLFLYKDNGESAEILRRIRNSLASQLRRHRQLQPALEYLKTLNCLEESTIVVENKGKKRSVSGLRCVNRDKILALPAETLGQLEKSGVMDILHAHWRSLRNLQLLLDDPSCPKQGAS